MQILLLFFVRKLGFAKRPESYFAVMLFASTAFANDDFSVYQSMIDAREPFFSESILQAYEITKIQRSKNGFAFIDFCMYPPDRSLPFGPLQNGRFHGEKIKDLPFACGAQGGAKNIFIQNSNILKAYRILYDEYNLSFLPKTPLNTQSINKDSSYLIWQDYDKKNDRYNVVSSGMNARRLWIIAIDEVYRYTIIFIQNANNTEVIIQYVLR